MTDGGGDRCDALSRDVELERKLQRLMSPPPVPFQVGRQAVPLRPLVVDWEGPFLESLRSQLPDRLLRAAELLHEAAGRQLDRQARHRELEGLIRAQLQIENEHAALCAEVVEEMAKRESPDTRITTEEMVESFARAWGTEWRTVARLHTGAQLVVIARCLEPAPAESSREESAPGGRAGNRVPLPSNWKDRIQDDPDWYERHLQQALGLGG